MVVAVLVHLHSRILENKAFGLQHPKMVLDLIITDMYNKMSKKIRTQRLRYYGCWFFSLLCKRLKLQNTQNMIIKKVCAIIAFIISNQFLFGAIPKDTLKLKEIREITVYSIATSKLALPYISVSKVSIEKNDFITPADALQSLSGVALTRDGIWATSLNIRGVNEQKLTILVDEDRIQTATDIAGSLSTVNVNQLEKIEIIKGAGSVLFGSGAMGGVINFVTQSPNYTPILSNSGNVGVGFHTVNKLWTNSANLNYTNKNWYLDLNGSYRTATSTQTPKGLLNNSQFNDASWGLKGGMKYGDNQELLVNYNQFDAWDVGLPGSNVFPPSAKVRYVGVKRRQMSGEYIFTDLSDLLTNLKIKAYNQNISRNVENIVNPSKTVLPASYNSTTGVKTTADLYFNDYNTLTVGAESWYRTSETTRLNITNDADTIVIAEQPTPSANILNVGAFALYKKIIDPKYFTLHAGLRFDYHRTQNDTAFKQVFIYTIIDGKKVDAVIPKVIQTDAGIKPEFSYSAHLDFEYNPIKRNKLILSLASAYRVASIEERFKYIDQEAGLLRIGNPNLKPEKGGFLNLCYLYSEENFRVKADIFANFMFDLITEKQGNYITSSGTTDSALINTNVNQSLYAGAELEIDWILNKSFWIFGNASYVRSHDIKTNEFLPQIPPLHGYLSANYRLEKKFEAELAAKWAATQNQRAPKETATKGHVIFNFNLHSLPLKIGKSFIQAFVGVDNLLDKAYKNHLFNTRGLDLYEPGRNVFVKLKWSWE